MWSDARILKYMIGDQVAVGLVGGALAGIFAGEGAGFSLLAACLWLALNFTALAWLMGALTSGQRFSKLFIFTLACAKIPASYSILYWLFTREYLEPMWLTVGIITFPAVLVFRGIKGRPASKRTGIQPEGD